MNVSGVHSCYGCGVCATVCARSVIEIKLNNEGFYEPYIVDESMCTDCGLCTEVCSYLHDELSLKNTDIQSYAAWSKDEKVRRKCSSGGVGFEVGALLLNRGYKVCGVRYNADNNRAEHYIASDIRELVQSAGSKYIQSYTVDAFKAINRKEKYLVTGTPCQIDSFRRYIQKFRCEDNFVLLDFFCHGVPSMFVWQKYIKWAEKKVGKITYASWRNKRNGWHDSWAMGLGGEMHGTSVDWHDSYNLLVKGERGFFNSQMSKGDMFYGFFLSDCCLGKQCYDNCKYKYKNSSADIRIGDLWGKTYKDNKDGVSAVVTFTPKGNELLKQCNCELVEHPFDIVAEFQMKACAKRSRHFNVVLNSLLNPQKDIKDAYKYVKRDFLRKRWKCRFRKILRILKISK